MSSNVTAQSITTLSAATRKAIRAAAGKTGTNYPIEVVHGDDAPKLVGQSYYWTTPGGTLVQHPSAFAKRGWPTVYHHSTLRIVVGDTWVAANT